MFASTLRRNVLVGVASALLATWGYLVAFSHIDSRATSLPAITLPSARKTRISRPASGPAQATVNKGQQVVLPKRTVAELPSPKSVTDQPGSESGPSTPKPPVGPAPPPTSAPLALPPVRIPNPPSNGPSGPQGPLYIPPGGTLTPGIGVRPGS